MMVSHVTGEGLGLYNTSLNLLGTATGNAQLGRNGNRVYVNNATGNLVIQQQDEFLSSLGLDLGLVRTYNSQGQFDDDNGDNWRLNVNQRLHSLTGTVNSAGSTITKVFGDGFESIYTYDTTHGRYISTDGDGNHDSLSYNDTTQEWTWSDGTPGVEEVYDANGQLLRIQDVDGNAITYTYTGSLITQITDASGQLTYLDYVGNNLSQVRIVSDGQTQVRTRYSYDAQDRLSQVTVDLSPEDADITDGNTYVTTYSYDGTSTRIASIASEDGTTVAIGYDADGRVATITDGAGQVSRYDYNTIAPTPASSLLPQLRTDITASHLDDLGRVIATENLDGTVTSYHYDETGRIDDVYTYSDPNTSTTPLWQQDFSVDAAGLTNLDPTHITVANGQLKFDMLNQPTHQYLGVTGDRYHDFTSGVAYRAELTTNPGTVPDGYVFNIGAESNTSGPYRAHKIRITDDIVNIKYVSDSGWETEATTFTIDSNTTYVFELVTHESGSTLYFYEKGQVRDSGIVDSRYYTDWRVSRLFMIAEAGPKVTDSIMLIDNITEAPGINIGDVYLRTSDTDRQTSYLYDDVGRVAGTLDRHGQLTSYNYDANDQLTDIRSHSVVPQDTIWEQDFSVGTGGLVFWPDPMPVVNGQLQVEVFNQTGVTVPYAKNIHSLGFRDGVSYQADVTLGVSTGREFTIGLVSGEMRHTINIKGNSARSITVSDAGWQSLPLGTVNDNTTYSFELVTHDSGTTLYFYEKGQARDSGLVHTLNYTDWGPAELKLWGGYNADATVDTTIYVDNMRILPRFDRYIGDYGIVDSGSDVVAGVDSHITTITDAHGNLTTYTTDAQGRLTSIQTPAIDGSRNTTQYQYDADGNLISVLDANTNTTEQGFNADGSLAWQQDAEGNRREYVYDANGLLVNDIVYRNEDPDGVTGPAVASDPVVSRYVYDSESHLRFTISADGRVSEQRYNVAGQRIASLVYTADNYDISALLATDTLSETQLDSWVAGITDKTRALRSDYSYDFRGNLATTTTYAGLDATGTGILDGMQSTTQFIYDQAGQVLQSIDANGTATTADPTDGITYYSYDGLGRLLTTTDVLGRITVNNYDDANQRLSTTLANGLTNTKVYDARGLLVSSTQSALDATPLGTTTYVYDERGQLKYSEDPIGRRAHRLYDEAGRVIATIDNSGALSENVYDRNNNVIQVITYGQTLSAGTLARLADLDIPLDRLRNEASTAEDRTAYTLYDKANRPVMVITTSDDDPGLGYVSQTFYDGAGQITDVIQYANAVELRVLDAASVPDDIIITPDSVNDRHSRSFYSDDGLLLGRLDAGGYLSETIYDAAGRVIESIAYANQLTDATLHGSGDFAAIKTFVGTNAADRHGYTLYNGKGQLEATIDADGYLTETAYDLNGNASSVIRYDSVVSYTPGQTLAAIRPMASATDQVSVTTYTALNQVATVTDSVTNTTRQYQYDEVGNLIATTTGLNTSEVRTVRSRYDAAGRVIGELTPQGSAVLDILLQGAYTQADIDNLWNTHGVTHTYDAAGRRLTSTDQNANTTWFYYDDAGRLSVTVHSADDGAAVVNRGEVTRTTYNSFGQMVDTTVYANRIDTTGLMGGNEADISTQLDALGDAVNDSTATVNYTLRGAVKQAIDAMGYRTDNTYTAFGEIETVTQQHSLPAGANTNPLTTGPSGDSLLSRFIYSQRGQQTDSEQDAAGINRHTQTSYDAFGRVTQSVDGNGIVTTFSYGTSSAPDTAGRQVVISSRAGLSSVTTYDAFGRTLRQQDVNGNITRYDYDDANRRMTITTPEGIVTSSQTNAHGETVQITDGNGNVTQYVYDINGNLDTMTEAFGSADAVVSSDNSYDNANRLIKSVDANGVVTIYQYDAANRLVQRIDDPTVDPIDGTPNPSGLNLITTTRYDAKGQVLYVTDANGTVTETRYDNNGRVTDIIVDPTSHNANGLNLHSQFSYDGLGNTLTVTEGVGNPDARTTEYQYDGLNRRTHTIVDPGGLNLVTQTEYDQNDNVVAIIDANGNVTRYVYDDQNRVNYVVDAEGGITQSIYDNNGNEVRNIAYANAMDVSALANQISAADLVINAEVSADRTTRYAYDTDNRLTFSIDTLGTVTATFYDDNDQVVSQVVYADAINAMTLSSLDALPVAYHLGTIAQAVGLPNLPNLQRDQATYFYYDSLNRLRISVDAAGYATQLDYDNNGNVITQTAYAQALDRLAIVNAPDQELEARSQLEQRALDPNNRISNNVYDAANRLRFNFDALGYITENSYDSIGQLSQITRYANELNDEAILTAAGFPVTVLSESEKRALWASVLNENSVSLGISTDLNKDQTTRYQYDAAGRLSITTDAKGYREYYGYDASGNKTWFTNKKGNGPEDASYTWRYDYDSANRLTRETTPAVEVTRLTENPDGSISEITMPEKIVTFMTYDGLGNVKTRTEAHGTVDARTTTYHYDALGRQIRTEFPDENFYNNTLDAQNNYQGRNESLQTPQTTTYYDTFGNAVANQDVLGNFSYKIYDTLGRVRYEIDAERYVTRYTYDGFGNQLTVTRYSQPLAESVFTGTALDAGTVVANLVVNADNDRIIKNDYDVLNRVIKTRQPAVYSFDSGRTDDRKPYFTAQPTTKNTYNAFGDVIKQATLKYQDPVDANYQEWSKTYIYYDNKGQKTAAVDAMGYVSEFQYDAVGNLEYQIEYAQALASNCWSTTGYGTPTITRPNLATDTSDIGFDRITRFEYDQLNQKTAEIKIEVQVSDPVYTGVIDTNVQIQDLVSRYTYDEVGNVTSVTDPSKATTFTYYDALGRITATAEPARLSESAGSSALPALTVTSQFIDIDTSSAEWYRVSDNYTTEQGWKGSNRIELNWQSLEGWGNGDVRVAVTYTKKNGSTGTRVATWNETLSAADGMRGASLNWAPSFGDVRSYNGLASVSAVQVWKTVNGQEILLHDTAGDSYRSPILTWEKASIAGTIATLEYRSAGSTGAWSNASILDWGSLYAVDLTGFATGQYEYRLTYARGEVSDVYAEGNGTFIVAEQTSVGGNHVVGEVETPFLDIDTSSAQWHKIYDGESFTDRGWNGSNRIELSWQSLESWGEGDVRVAVTYLKKKGSSGTLVATWNETLSAADGMRGASLNWAPGSDDVGDYNGLASVSSVQVWKTVGTEEILLHSSGIDTVAAAPRLVLRGATTGLTGINISGVGVREGTPIGGGMYAVDLSGLAPGSYSYTPQGTVSNLGGTFTLHGNVTSAHPMVQESMAFLDIDTSSAESYRFSDNYTTEQGWKGSNRIELNWQSLEHWGNGDVRVAVTYTKKNGSGRTQVVTWNETLKAADAMRGASLNWAPGSNDVGDYNGLVSVSSVQVWKTVNGEEILLHDTVGGDVYTPRLDITNLGTNATDVTFEYKPVNSGLYQSKSTTKMGNGWFSTNYGDIPIGHYDFRLTVDGVVSTGSFEIKRGGQDIPEVIGGGEATLIPISTFDLDVFGNTVHQVRYANGAGNANVDNYTLLGNDINNDQHSYNLYNNYGQLRTTIDGEGARLHSSYDAQGNVRKQWRTLTDIDGNSQQQTSIFTYDKIGQQVETGTVINTAIQTSNVDREQVRYNAFGEIVAKGLNDGWQEYFDFDAAGRVWRTNQQDGVNKVFLYNLQNNVTAQITSATLDLESAAYAQASDVADLTTDVVRTETHYDKLGRSIKQIQPSSTITGPEFEPITESLAVSRLYVDHSFKSEVGDDAFTVNGYTYEQRINHRVDVNWSSLEAWGDGLVRVQVDTNLGSQTKTLNAGEGIHGAAVQWTSDFSSGFLSPNSVHNPGEELTSVSRVQVWKQIGGQNGPWVQVIDRSSEGVYGDEVTWAAPEIVGTQVQFEARTLGSSNVWTSLTANLVGDRYRVDVSSLVADRYEYRITYTRPRENEAYAQGMGEFAIQGLAEAGSMHVVGHVESAFAGASFVSELGDDALSFDNYTYTQLINHRVDVNWSSLEAWGDGVVTVQVDTNLGNKREILNAGEGMHGAVLQWTRSISSAGSNQDGFLQDPGEALTNVSRVQVWKKKIIGGVNVDVLVHDSANGVGERLVLSGATLGLTGVTIDGVGTRGVTPLGAGLFAVDVSDLASGTYTYTPVGTGVTTAATFEVRGAGLGGTPVLQEQVTAVGVEFNSEVGDDASRHIISDGYTYMQRINHRVDLSWASLEGWGNGKVRVTVDTNLGSKTKSVIAGDGMLGTVVQWTSDYSAGLSTQNRSLQDPGEALTSVSRVLVEKFVNNEWVVVYDHPGTGDTRVLSATQLPATATNVTLEYRRAGSTGQYLSEVMTRVGTGYFTVPYGDMPIGKYEYRLVADLLISDGYNTWTQQQVYKGTYDIKRGGQSVIPTNDDVTKNYQSVMEQNVDRWGNILSITSGKGTITTSGGQGTVLSTVNHAGNVSSYRYNYANQVIAQVQAETDIWNADGTSHKDTPTILTYYDSRGLAVAQQDANGNINAQRYDQAGQLVAEYHADSGVIKYTYDALGRKVERIGARGNINISSYAYDRNDRLVEETLPLGFQSYTYDEAGNRTSTTKALDETTNATTRYFYDTRNNLILTRRPLDIREPGGIQDEGLTTYNALGRKISEENRNGDYQTWNYDYFGRLTDHRDLGGNTTSYVYNELRQLIHQTSVNLTLGNQDLSYEYYENGNLKHVVDNALRGKTSYEYDLAGNQTRERFIDQTTGIVYQDVQIDYDELNRIKQVEDNRYELKYFYDANGNRRRTLTNYYDINGNHQSVDHWYAYDEVNRIVLSQGEYDAVNKEIKITPNKGIELEYDTAGNRLRARTYEDGLLVEDSYDYDGMNRLTSMFRAGSVTSTRVYDLAGRQTEYFEYSGQGVMKSRRTMDYNANGWLLRQENYNSNDIKTSTLRYDHANSYDAVGNRMYYTLDVHTGTQYSQTFSYNYLKLDSYREKQIDGRVTVYYDYGGNPTRTGKTTESYDVNGNLIKVVDTFNNTPTRDFIVNSQGVVLQKIEGADTQYYYYANGKPVGSLVPDGKGGTTADFDFNYTPVSEVYPAQTPSSYTVGEGDTLQSIALSLYGDAKLWYLIADANGVTDATLKAGMNLTIPNTVTNIHNNVGTFKPYNPSVIIGDTTPTTPFPDPPSPPNNGGCSTLAIVAVVAVAIVLTVFTAGAAAIAMSAAYTSVWAAGTATLAGSATGLGVAGSFAAAAAGGAAGSIGSQLVGMGLGVQEEFSWGAVATSALGAGVTAGVGAFAGQGGIAARISNNTGRLMANAAAGNAINQGVAMFTGQQDKFNWRSIVASSLAAPLTAKIGGNTQDSAKFSVNGFAKRVGSEIAKGTITQGANMLVGNRGKMDWTSIATNAFGNAIGNAIVAHGAFKGEQTAGMRLLEEAGINYRVRDDGSLQVLHEPQIGHPVPDRSPRPEPMPSGLEIAPVVRRRKIKAGDSFWNIAKTELGEGASDAQIRHRAQQLMQANPNLDPRKLKIGSEINLASADTEVKRETIERYNESNSEYQEYLEAQQNSLSALTLREIDENWDTLFADSPLDAKRRDMLQRIAEMGEDRPFYPPLPDEDDNEVASNFKRGLTIIKEYFAAENNGIPHAGEMTGLLSRSRSIKYGKDGFFNIGLGKSFVINSDGQHMTGTVFSGEISSQRSNNIKFNFSIASWRNAPIVEINKGVTSGIQGNIDVDRYFRYAKLIPGFDADLSIGAGTIPLKLTESGSVPVPYNTSIGLGVGFDLSDSKASKDSSASLSFSSQYTHSDQTVPISGGRLGRFTFAIQDSIMTGHINPARIGTITFKDMWEPTIDKWLNNMK